MEPNSIIMGWVLYRVFFSAADLECGLRVKGNQVKILNDPVTVSAENG